MKNLSAINYRFFIFIRGFEANIQGICGQKYMSTNLNLEGIVATAVLL